MAVMAMNRIAITIWRERVSPVFESAARVLAVDLEENKEISRREYLLPVNCQTGHGAGRYMAEGDYLFRKVQRLNDIGAKVLICGAISDRLIGLLNSRGVSVIGWISGGVGEVISAYIDDSIYDPAFLMPGRGAAGGRHRRRRRGCRGVGRNKPQAGWWNGEDNGPAG